MSKVVKLKQSDIEKIVTNIVNEHMDQENSIAKEEETNEEIGGNGVVLGVAKGEDGRFYVMNAKTGEILGVK
jgi:cell division protein FtsI/penicillin-binding protein 2